MNQSSFGLETSSRKQTFKNDLKLFGNIKVLCISALLCAMTFILAYLAKVAFGPGPLRFTIENIPIVLAGILFGPLVGVTVGVGADLLSCIAAGMSPNPLITVSVGVIGLLSGIISHYIIRKTGFWQILTCETICHIIGSMVLKSLALHSYGYEWSYLVLRIPIYCGVIVIETLLLWLMLRNNPIQKEIGRIFK